MVMVGGLIRGSGGQVRRLNDHLYFFSFMANASERATKGRFKLRTSALRAYTMLLALIVIWLFFQWATIDQYHPYGLFLGAINFSKLLQQMAVTGVLAVGMLM